MSMQVANTVSSSTTVQSPASTSPRTVRHEREGDEGERRRVGGERGRQQFFDAVSSALSALGLSLPTQQTPPQSQATPPTAGQEGTPAPDNNAQPQNNVQQALHSFMHDLFKALKSQGENRGGENRQGAEKSGDDDSSREVRRGSESYRNDLASRVQDLVQKYSASDAGSTKTDALQSSFAKLVQTLQPATSTDTSTPAKAPDLQAFLQGFLKNLQGGSTPVSPVGVAVNTQA
jgi:hypothetical protein